MANLLFDEGLVTIVDDPVDYADVEKKLAKILLSRGLVRDTYPAAIVEREKSYPTALDVGGINLAMPHCDVEHVVRGALCVGILKRPISWYRMDAPEIACDVSLVVMLALNETHSHLEMIQRVVGLIQDQKLMGQIVTCDTLRAAYELLDAHLS